MYCEEVPLNTPNPPDIFEFASEGAPNGPAGLLKANEYQKSQDDLSQDDHFKITESPTFQKPVVAAVVPSTSSLL